MNIENGCATSFCANVPFVHEAPGHCSFYLSKDTADHFMREREINRKIGLYKRKKIEGPKLSNRVICQKSFMYPYFKSKFDTMVQWLALSAHSKRVVSSISSLGPLFVQFACSPCVCIGSLRVR